MSRFSGGSASSVSIVVSTEAKRGLPLSSFHVVLTRYFLSSIFIGYLHIYELKHIDSGCGVKENGSTPIGTPLFS